MTEDIGKRTVRHKTGNGCKFTKDYEVNKLVYLEKCENRQTAMTRETIEEVATTVEDETD